MIRSLKVAVSLMGVTLLSACAHGDMNANVSALEAKVTALEAKVNDVSRTASTAKVDAATALHIAVPMQDDVAMLKADVQALNDSHKKKKKMMK